MKRIVRTMSSDLLILCRLTRGVRVRGKSDTCRYDCCCVVVCCVVKVECFLVWICFRAFFLFRIPRPVRVIQGKQKLSVKKR